MTSLHTPVVLWCWVGLWIASHSWLCINGPSEPGRLTDVCVCQWVKELNILTLAFLYIFEVNCFIRKYCQSLEQNSRVHQYNAWRKLDIHVKLQKTEIYRKSVIYMGTKVYKNLPKFLKEIDYYKAFNRFNAVLNPIYHLLALLEAHPILHISRIRVKAKKYNALW